jgi:hypothetical protein
VEVVRKLICIFGLEYKVSTIEWTLFHVLETN